MMNTKGNLIKGLSILTTIDEHHLNRLVDLSKLVIVDEIVEQLQQGQDVIKIDLGIGDLLMHYSGESIKFKFTPNAKFEEDIANACIHQVNLIDDKVESTLKDKIVNTYKDLL